jgi:hypothetical protein
MKNDATAFEEKRFDLERWSGKRLQNKRTSLVTIVSAIVCRNAVIMASDSRTFFEDTNPPSKFADCSNSGGLVGCRQMPLASYDNRLSEILKRWFWRRQIVIPARDIVFKNFFGGISCWVKRI